MLLILVGVACETANAPPPIAPPVVTTAAPAVARPLPDAAVADVLSVDAATTVPPDLSAAPAWLGRSLYTGLIRAKAVHTRASLQRLDTRALLTLEVRELPLRLDGKEPGPWGTPTTTRYQGTLTNGQLELTIGSEAVSLACVEKTVAVAPAEAHRARNPKLGGCEGDTGHWVPGATHKVKALVCGDPSSEIDPSFTFVAPPGPEIEWVYVNDDCVMQGGGYRDVPNDGTIASPR